jgi:ATP-dependent protease ClpP protease subunit
VRKFRTFLHREGRQRVAPLFRRILRHQIQSEYFRMNVVNVSMSADRRARVDFYGEIGPSSLGMIDAAKVSEQVSKIPNASEIELHINSRGGSAYDGLAIASILRDHPAKKIGVVDGIAASAATLPLMVCDVVRIPKNALMMLHDPIVAVVGGERSLQMGIDQLKALKAACVALYAVKSGKSEAEVSAIMSATTWYQGQQAVDARFADTVDAPLAVDRVPQNTAGIAEMFKQAPWMSVADATQGVSDSVLQVRREAIAALDRQAADPNAKYVAEYKANPGFAEVGLSETDYIASRRIDDCLDVLAFGKSRVTVPESGGPPHCRGGNVGSDDFLATGRRIDGIG